MKLLYPKNDCRSRTDLEQTAPPRLQDIKRGLKVYVLPNLFLTISHHKDLKMRILFFLDFLKFTKKPFIDLYNDSGHS